VKLREIQRIVAIAIRDEMTLHVAVMESGTAKEEHH
jgi:hypothetical protein